MNFRDVSEVTIPALKSLNPNGAFDLLHLLLLQFEHVVVDRVLDDELDDIDAVPLADAEKTAECLRR